MLLISVSTFFTFTRYWKFLFYRGSSAQITKIRCDDRANQKGDAEGFSREPLNTASGREPKIHQSVIRNIIIWCFSTLKHHDVPQIAGRILGASQKRKERAIIRPIVNECIRGALSWGNVIVDDYSRGCEIQVGTSSFNIWNINIIWNMICRRSSACRVTL